ncbi:S8 family peptidase [Salipaludibacillus sp. LMS25]|uniref:S8 family peptidase n=1 Tax=Salipaludibacillus sp. LMS25 TaxID=2924031 RepID=UPI0020D116B0|nr:S8 family peptidase [Salipaludibacillus sp. LMS25]UTR16448.1 S8 family peptidase [Salipaludibacillus sp. LMS25]
MKKLLLAWVAVALMFVFSATPGFASGDSTDRNSSGGTKEYLVMFEEDSADVSVMDSIGISQSNILYEFELLPVLHVKLSETQVNSLEKHPQIKTVEENTEVKAYQQQTPWGITRVQGTAAQAQGYTGNNVKVAILDTGIDRSHPDLSANVRGGYSVFGDSPYNDGNGHGTHVAGTVGAVNNNIGVIGVAPQADLYAVRVLNNAGSGSYAGIAQGIEWSINNGMDIINMSLGGPSSSSILEQYCNLAYNRGLLVVAAAGNSGTAAGNTNTVGYPARYNSVIAVAATNSNNVRASFSSTGPTVELSAPGVNVLSTTPGGNYASYNGTSMASPHVAGVAAQVWQARPNLSNVQLRQILNASAQNLGTSYQYGNGLVRSLNAIQY